MSSLRVFEKGLRVLFCGAVFSFAYCAGANSPAEGQLQAFASIFEPSGLVHLGGGEFMLVEDEPEQPFHRLKLDLDGSLLEMGAVNIAADPIRLNDLEGVAFDGHYLYAITSHSLTKKGKTGKGRQVLIRFEYVDGKLRETRRVDNLKEVLIQRFSSSLSNRSADEISADINIEALSWSPTDESLYVGFRNPRRNGNSAVLQIHNPGAMFEQQSAAVIKTRLFWLDLNNRGIRSMNWDTTLASFVIVAGGKKSTGKGFDLWRWNPDIETPALRITPIEKPLPSGTEGLVIFATGGQFGMLLVMDDGSEKKSRPAHYQLFPFKLD